MTALPANLARRVESALARDGYPRVRLLTAPRVLVAWWLVGGGQAAKRAALDRLRETSSQARWVLLGHARGRRAAARCSGAAVIPHRSRAGQRRDPAAGVDRRQCRAPTRAWQRVVLRARRGARLRRR